MLNSTTSGIYGLLPELIWFIVGILFMFLEFVLPGVIIVFFGIGAVLTAILTWIGILPNLPSQLIFFLASSVLSLFTLRKYFSKWMKGKEVIKNENYDIEEEFIGKKVKVTKDIEPGNDFGRVLFDGTEWKATADETIQAGTVVEILKKENITFTVKSTSKE